MNVKILTIATAFALSASAAFAQQGSPACQRLEAQLSALDRGNDDPGRAEQIRRAEQAVNQQQFEVDKLVAASRRQGCEGASGFFSIFSNPPAQCGGLTRQIDQQRSLLERMQNDLERLNGGTTERAAARRSLLISLSDQGCGPQYRSAAIAGQQGGFFDRLFGNTPFSGMGQGGTFRTICVRTCDGYYYPISFATTPNQFPADAQACQRMCPAAEVTLYTYRNPGEEVNQAVSLNGRMYTELPTAFAYRQKYNPECSCRKAGQSWADALKTINDNTVEQGDIIVNEQRARQLSQPRIGPDGKPIRQDPRGPLTTNSIPGAATAAEPEPANKTIRSVGPQFYPVR